MGDGGWRMGDGGWVGGIDGGWGGGGDGGNHIYTPTKYCVVRFNVLIHEMLLLFFVDFFLGEGGTILLSPQA